MEKWEYKKVYFGGFINGKENKLNMCDFESESNKLGENGWELVSVTYNGQGSNAFFKRKIQ